MNQIAEIEPWSQRPDEPDSAYAAFVVYLDAADRSGAAIARLLGCSVSTVYRYRSLFDWTARLSAYLERDVSQRAAAREVAREAGRQTLVDAVELVSGTLVDMALARQWDSEKGAYRPRLIKANTQLAAIKTILDRAGVVATKRVEVEQNNALSDNQRHALEVLDALDDSALEQLAAATARPIVDVEPEGDE